MWLSLLFSQLIKNNLSNRCRIHKIYPSGPYRILCLFFFSVIITNSYLRARTIQTSSLPNDSSRPLFKQIEIFSAILTVYFSYKYFPLYTRATRVPPLDFAFLAKSLQGQSIPQISPKKWWRTTGDEAGISWVLTTWFIARWVKRGTRENLPANVMIHVIVELIKLACSLFSTSVEDKVEVLCR